MITVRGGQGGDGEAWQGSKPKTVKNFKYQWGRNIKKYIDLPAAEPADNLDPLALVLPALFAAGMSLVSPLLRFDTQAVSVHSEDVTNPELERFFLTF